MLRPLTVQETFATVLTRLVQQRCTEQRTQRISRSALQTAVPVDERPTVRRALDALVDAGILAQNTNELGLTPAGSAFLSFAGKLERRVPTEPEQDDSMRAVLAALQEDERLAPRQELESIRTLPARLETLEARRQPAFWRNALILMLVVIVIVAVVRLR
ncbi:MAG: hypothetical protein ABWZ88_12680 [Variovorax sp.]